MISRMHSEKAIRKRALGALQGIRDNFIFHSQLRTAHQNLEIFPNHTYKNPGFMQSCHSAIEP